MGTLCTYNEDGGMSLYPLLRERIRISHVRRKEYQNMLAATWSVLAAMK
jgi:hypothetical protein